MQDTMIANRYSIVSARYWLGYGDDQHTDVYLLQRDCHVLIHVYLSLIGQYWMGGTLGVM